MTELGLIAKYWRPGEVKTRLARDVGPNAAAELQRAFLQTSLRRLATLADRNTLVYSPDGQWQDFANLTESTMAETASNVATWICEPQGDGDLGQRMAAYLARAIARGARRIVLLGSDSPNVPLEYVGRGFDLLEEHAVVLGPAEDGGYYLVGVSGSVPPIFTDIAWSTPNVWPRTIERLTTAGAKFATLPPWYDVDGLPDLRRLQSDLLTGTGDDADLARLYRQIERIAADPTAPAAHRGAPPPPLE